MTSLTEQTNCGAISDMERSLGNCLCRADDQYSAESVPSPRRPLYPISRPCIKKGLPAKNQFSQLYPRPRTPHLLSSLPRATLQRPINTPGSPAARLSFTVWSLSGPFLLWLLLRHLASGRKEVAGSGALATLKRQGLVAWK